MNGYLLALLAPLHGAAAIVSPDGVEGAKASPQPSVGVGKAKKGTWTYAVAGGFNIGAVWLGTIVLPV